LDPVLRVPLSGINVYTLAETSSPQNYFGLMGTVSVKVDAAGNVEISEDNYLDKGYIGRSVDEITGAAEITVRNVSLHQPPDTPPLTPPDNPPQPDNPTPDNPDITTPTSTPSAFSIYIAKRSDAESNPLPALSGAAFTLKRGVDSNYDYNKTDVTNADGMLSFDFDNADNFDGNYTLTEESAPNHTPLSQPIRFTVSEGKITNVRVDDADRDYVTWLGIDDEEHNHEYVAFRIVNKTPPPPLPPSTNNGPPPSEPEKPAEPEVPAEPEEPEEPSSSVPETPDGPDSPDNPTPPDTSVRGDMPQTGDDANTTLWLLLTLLAMCGAAVIWRLRENGKRGAERR
jgi:uncharacterized surface anchored protein